MRRIISGFVVAALLALVVGAPVGATTAISGGNTVISRAYLDSYSNFVIVDTNNPISGAGMLTSWSFWAGATSGVQLVVVRNSGGTVSVVGESVMVTPSLAQLGTVVTSPLSPAIAVRAGDEVGLYFASTGVVPFDGIANGGTSGTVLYTINGYGDPSVGAALTFEGAVDRMYSVSVSGAPSSFTGFYAPIDMPPIVNTVKGGSVVPVKFNLYDGSGVQVTDPSLVTVSAAQTTCTASAATDAIEVVSSVSSALRYDSTAMQFIWNWKTLKVPGTCWTVTATATTDGTSITALFLLK